MPNRSSHHARARRRHASALGLAMLSLTAIGYCAGAGSGKTDNATHTLSIDGMTRVFRVDAPGGVAAAEPRPRAIAFHGGGIAQGLQRLQGFLELLPAARGAVTDEADHG